MARDLFQFLARGLRPGLCALVIPGAVASCSPTVRVEAPAEPIRIDLNVRIQQDVYIRLEREVEELHRSNPGIF
ncbi:YnbE family lipoprotein [Phaeovibrio sulfidiphilus]|uniref:YnbE family lipoprotein n=1 Tax=Phaeovibrio sulfidiphilus TaxID=1220600 RepID=A0A8J6YP41_9PROT|nr:YnbE family lipoprotein [Phaeovibrio sulfidiphilus]MBE1236971.1 YnbE family lipoprotein [Phaeovibrio sulfidiphilus]